MKIYKMRIVNIIASLKTHKSIDLKLFYEKFPYLSKYTPERFPGLRLRLPEPKVTILLFKNGNLVLTGADTKDNVYLGFERVLELLELSKVLLDKVQIDNYVATGAVNSGINLSLVYEKCRPNAILEPELFPGLKYYLKNQKVTALIFHSGKYVLTGCKVLADVYRANIIIQSLLHTCFKITVPK